MTRTPLHSTPAGVTDDGRNLERLPLAPLFQEIEPQLRELLAEERAREKFEEWIATLRERIYIRIVRGGGIEE